MRERVAILLSAVVLAAATRVYPQEQPAFKARLSPVPISADMAARITGSGSVTAALNGRTLTLAGLFTGLQSPATVAQVHIGERTGVRGPAAFEVRIDRATTGSLSATLELSEAQVGAFTRGLFYVQVHSEMAPEGNLWGWLLPQVQKQ